MDSTPHSVRPPSSPATRLSLRAGLHRPLHLPFRLWAEHLNWRPVEALLLATLLLAILGGSLLWLAERGSPATELHSWWDGLWLAVTSVNENYGDLRPTTSLSRLLAALVATLGVLLIGSFTAVVTNLLLGDEHRQLAAELREISVRLERIEAQLARRPDSLG